MTSETVECFGDDPDHNSTAHGDAQQHSADVNPSGSTRPVDLEATGFLFCLRCGTAMVGKAECPKCGFPRKASGLRGRAS